MSQSTFSGFENSLLSPMYWENPKVIRRLKKGWAGRFRENILPQIIECESMFAPFYSDKKNTRPSTPTYYVLGVLLTKHIFCLTDDQIVSHMQTDLAFKYALGTEALLDQPVNERTLNRFRAQNELYFLKTGINLIEEFFKKMSDLQVHKYLKNRKDIRMDSIMVSGNTRHLSRLQLAHVVVSNAVNTLAAANHPIPYHMAHYLDENDENRVTYHDRQTSGQDKLKQAMSDAWQIFTSWPEELQDEEDFKLLSRFVAEQIELNEDGTFKKIRDGKDLNSRTLLNPAEPEQTFRKKAGKDHHGYVGNFAETVDTETGLAIIDSVDFVENTHSDVDFCDKELDKRIASDTDGQKIVVDGAYISMDLIEKAEENGIKLIGTNMVGKDTPDLMADFEITEDGDVICPNGCQADRTTWKGSSVYVSMDKTRCENCPHQKNCPLTERKRVRSGMVSQKAINRAKIQRTMTTEEFVKNYRFRNGVEAIPSQLRRDQNIDKMPVRGKSRKAAWYYLSLMAINARRIFRFLNSLGSVRPNEGQNAFKAA